jgi:hypothetical protein
MQKRYLMLVRAGTVSRTGSPQSQREWNESRRSRQVNFSLLSWTPCEPQWQHVFEVNTVIHSLHIHIIGLTSWQQLGCMCCWALYVSVFVVVFPPREQWATERGIFCVMEMWACPVLPDILTRSIWMPPYHDSAEDACGVELCAFLSLWLRPPQGRGGDLFHTFFDAYVWHNHGSKKERQ